MRKSLLFFALLASVAAPAQTIRNAGSFIYTRSTAYSNDATDAFSFGGNVGALAIASTFSAGLFSERRFHLKELSAYAAAVTLPTSSGCFGLQADYLGSIAYNEASLGLAYARKLGGKVSLGMQFNYFSLAAAGYDAASAVNVDVGMIIRLTPQLAAGIQAGNAVGTSWSKTGMGRQPAVFRVGMGYTASPAFFFSAEAEKVEEKPVGIHAGFQYMLAGKLAARAGIQSATAAYYLGFGVKMKNLRFDITASLHPYLGLTPGLLLLYTSQ